MGAVRPDATVRNKVAAELAAGSLNGLVHLASRHPEALGDNLEVMDESFHRLAHDMANVLIRIALTVGAQS